MMRFLKFENVIIYFLHIFSHNWLVLLTALVQGTKEGLNLIFTFIVNFSWTCTFFYLLLLFKSLFEKSSIFCKNTGIFCLFLIYDKKINQTKDAIDM